MTIKVTYRSIDRVRMTRSFKTLEGARRFAVLYVGETPEMGSHYAVSSDGVGKVTVTGAALADLFPALQPDKNGQQDEIKMDVYGDGLRKTMHCPGHPFDGQRTYNTEADDAAAMAESRLWAEPVSPCGCSPAQLRLVGCDCEL